VYVKFKTNKIMDLLLAILISMGVNVTPQDISNKDWRYKHASEIQQAQTQLHNLQTETTIPHFNPGKRNGSTPVVIGPVSK
jgi:hypothetical protein